VKVLCATMPLLPIRQREQMTTQDLAGVAAMSAPLPLRKRPINSGTDVEIKIKNTFICVELTEPQEHPDRYVHHKGAQTCTAQLSEELTWSAAEVDRSPLDTCSTATRSLSFVPFTVKNTFISMETDDAVLDCDLHRTGVHTCAARFADQLAAFPDPEGFESDCDSSSAFTDVSTPLDDCWFESTKEQFSISLRCIPCGLQGVAPQPDYAEALLPIPSLLQAPKVVLCLDTTVITSASSNSNVTSVQCASSAKNVAVCCHWKNKGFCKYQQDCKFSHPADKQGAGPSKRRRKPTTPPMTPTTPPTETETTPTQVAVCCHWKNKGYCEFNDSCKFAHPAHKQGVGIAQQSRSLAPRVVANSGLSEAATL